MNTLTKSQRADKVALLTKAIAALELALADYRAELNRLTETEPVEDRLRLKIKAVKFGISPEVIQ
jgi:hypothetical protein